MGENVELTFQVVELIERVDDFESQLLFRSPDMKRSPESHQADGVEVPA